MSRLVAAARAGRLLTIAPWIASRSGPSVDDVCGRFGIDRDELYSDLGVLSMVGVPPYSPDTLVDVSFEDDRVWVTLGPYFRRPMRLSPVEGMTLVAAARILGADDPVLASAADKISAVIGDGTMRDALSADLGDVPDRAVTTLREAIETRHRVRIDYYGYGSAQRSVRDVDPHRLHVADGHWYLAGHCHLADAPRLFRLDRVHSLELLDQLFEPPGTPVVAEPFATVPDDSVTLRLSAPLRWIVESYPAIASTELADGAIEVQLAVGGQAWLERLLLRLGEGATIVGGVVDGDDVGPEPYVAMRSAAASRILERYAPS